MTIVLVWLLAAQANGPPAWFAEGNSRYQEGAYQEALANYLRIADAGYRDATLYYNIGNAYFKLGELGRAILYYERAQRLSPGDDDTAANLALARSLTLDQVTPAPEFWLFRVARWWVYLVPRGALMAVVAAAWLAVAAGVVVRTLAREPRAARRGLWTAAAAAGVLIVFGVNLAVRELGIGQPDAAIVLAPEVAVQSAPADDPSLQVFAIHAGTKVTVDRTTDGWVEIVLADGKVGWVRQDQVSRI